MPVKRAPQRNQYYCGEANVSIDAKHIATTGATRRHALELRDSFPVTTQGSVSADACEVPSNFMNPSNPSRLSAIIRDKLRL